jgi:hypothetical protein
MGGFEMKSIAISAALLLVSCLAWAESHDEMSPEEAAMMEAWTRAATPGEQHQHLAGSAGDWTATVKMYMDPGAEPDVMDATVNRTMTLNGRVLEEDWQGEFQGEKFHGIGRTGYDNVTGRYWSTWTDNMSTGLMTSWGDWDEAQQAYVFHGEASDPMTGGRIGNRTVITMPADGEEVMEMYETRGGEEMMTMRIELKRR